MIKKLIGALFLLILISASIYFYREYNRKPADLTNVKPAFVITTENLINEFENDEQTANKKYLGKVVQVSGLLASAAYNGDTLVNIIIGDGLHKVSCELNKRDAKTEILPQQEAHLITVKGICTGFLMDVELNRCVIVK